MLRTALHTPARFARSFLPSAMPPLGRASYRWELISVSFMPMAVACVEGGVLGVIAKKSFNAPDLAIATLSAAPAIASLTSILWTRLLHARDRVRITNALQLATLACVAAIALAPFSPLGVAIIVVAQLLARSFLTGIISARADIWLANYPRHDRARVTGRLAVVTTIVVLTTAATIGWSMDFAAANGHGFRYVYGAAILLALIGVWAYSNVRWRGRAAQLASERRSASSGKRAVGPRAMMGVLRNDAAYRRYMVAQFVLGVPNLAALPVFIIALKDHFAHLGYGPSIALTQVIPSGIVPVLLIPAWAKLLDRMHIVRFRAIHSWVFVIANALMGVGFILESLTILTIARIVLGAAFAGGILAWQLGHNDFADRDMAPLYMGVHVTLTGVRGFFSPFVGTILYAGAFSIGAHHIHLFPGLDGWTFIVLAAVSALGAILFLRLLKDLPPSTTNEPTHPTPMRN